MAYSKYSGKVRIQNESKYLGDSSNIIYRSSWELYFAKFLDFNDNVIFWNSEEIIIPYFYPVDGKMHRYFPDFFVEFKNNKKVIIEIKPHAETLEPVLKKNKKTFIQAMESYIKNCAKWEAAKEYCDQRGIEFRVFTEHDLSKLKSSKN